MMSGDGEAGGFPGGFTVLMAVYGKDDPELFTKAVESVYANDLRPDGMVLAVDGPVPECLDGRIAAAEERFGVEAVRLEKNCGLAEALNEGLRYIRTEWVVRADADDINLPRRFSRLASQLRAQPDLDLVGSAILELERDGTPVARRVMPESQSAIRSFMERRNPFNHMTVAYRRAMVERCGGYPDVYLREDYALWVKMIMSGARCANLSEVLVHATAGRDMYSRRSGWRYARGERDLQGLMVRLGVKSRLRALVDGMARSSVFIAPGMVRRLIYERALRRPAVNVTETISGRKS